MPVAIVTGSSTGIGFATSLTLAKEGFRTYATMRNLNKSSDLTSRAIKEDLTLTALQMDVDDDKSVNDTIEKIMNDSGRIDVVVNNAGYALIGAFEESTIQDAKSQHEIEPFGVKVVLIEPGAVKSDFWKNLKSSGNIEDSPYRPVMQKLVGSFEKMTQNAISPEQVARVILHAVKSDSPDFRNIVGEDAKSILEVRSTNSDKEFQTFMKKQFGI